MMEEKETVDCSQSLGVIGYGKRRNYSIILIDPNQICRTNERIFTRRKETADQNDASADDILETN